MPEFEENNNSVSTNETVISPGLLELSNALEGIKNAGEILKETGREATDAGLIKVVEKQSQPNTTPEVPVHTEENNDTPPNDNGENVAPEEPGTQESVQEPVDEDFDDLDENNPLTKLVVGKDKLKKGPLVIENFDHIKLHAKKAFGIEVKSEKDFDKFFSAAKKWREDASQVSEIKSKLEDMENLFNELPSSLLDSVKAYFNGDQNWSEHISKRSSFDFNKPVDKQDKKSLVSHYFPGEFTEADWEAETEPKALKVAIQASKDKYIAQKRELENESAKLTTDADSRREGFKKSISGSLKALKTSFPELETKDIKDIQVRLESGDINSLFYDKNGTYREDAAERLLLAMCGKDAIKSAMKVAARRAESKTNEELLSRGATKPKPETKGGSAAQQVDPEVNKAIDALVGGLNKKTTY